MQALFGLLQVRNALQETAQESIHTLLEDELAIAQRQERAKQKEARITAALEAYDALVSTKGEAALPTEGVDTATLDAVSAAFLKITDYTKLEINRTRRELEAVLRYADDADQGTESMHTEADELYNLYVEGTALADMPERVNGVVKQAASTAYQNFEVRFEKERRAAARRLIEECEHLHVHYYILLRLAIDVAKFAVQDEDERQQRLMKPAAQQPYQLKLAQNPVLLAIEELPEYQQVLIRQNVHKFDVSFVRQVFTEIVATDQTYQEYSNAFSDDMDFEKHRTFARHLATRLLLKADVVQDWFAEQDLYWDDNRDIVKNMLVKTLKSQPDEAGKPSLSPLSADWEDDKDFTQKLFNQTIEHQRAYVRLLGEQSDNWDASRFSHTDMVIMTMCLTEVLNFQQIPVKVSINEYLEVARQYSTPQSFQFINAVLDALAQKLQEQGRVKKTGRGLI